MLPTPESDDWAAISAEPLPVGDVVAWAVRPNTGALVTFSGTVRDHSAGRVQVTALDYEAWEPAALARLEAVIASARSRWPDLERVALLHRIGHLALSEISVVVVVSSPHRATAFEAARFCIDTVKQSVPIWKRETWAGGSDWAQDDHEITEIGAGPLEHS